jgi:hypothetical protein
MQAATPKMRKLAERLIVEEAKLHKPGDAKAKETFAVSARLRPQLTVLMGAAGYRAVVSRAMTLASAELKWLGEVRVDPDGSLQGLEELAAKFPAGAVAQGRVTQLAHLLELLVSFIGEGLTTRLVRELYPKLSDDDFNFATKG